MTQTEGLLDGKLAWRRVEGKAPTLIWIGGFMSNMTGSKAQTLANWARRHGRDFLRFDYSGHGQSGGKFTDGTISRWREEVLSIINRMTSGPVILIGSSMGGWLACLAALARPDRVKAIVLIAPAADFTSALMEPQIPPEGREDLALKGVWMHPSPYDPEGYPVTRQLLEDGRAWTILPGPIALDMPIRILQGGKDAEVPWPHALKLAEALSSPDLVFSLIKDGDHRLSRDQDLQRLIATVEELLN